MLNLNNLLDRNRVIQIRGVGGVDKTALAKLCINRYYKSYDVTIGLSGITDLSYSNTIYPSKMFFIKRKVLIVINEFSSTAKGLEG